MTTENADTSIDTTDTADDTDTGSTETTDSPRDIQTLLSLKTYQGMTDEEIQIIIDFKEEQARNDTVTNAKVAMELESINATTEIRNQVASEANDILKQLLSKSLDLTTIKDDDAQEG